MKIKLIAIGNRIMGDDGVAIAAAEVLQTELDPFGIQTIIGETDVEYCLSLIEEDDAVIVLDASNSGRTLGTVWKLPLGDALAAWNHNQTQHDVDLLTKLKMSGIQITGMLICIEVRNIELRWGLSEEMRRELPEICRAIKNIIIEFRGDMSHA